MSTYTSLRIGLFLWTVAFVIAFVDLDLGAPDWLMLGVPSVWSFLIWQGIAVVFAVYVWITGRRFEAGSRERLASRLPGVIQIALAIALALFALTAQFLSPDIISGVAPLIEVVA